MSDTYVRSSEPVAQAVRAGASARHVAASSWPFIANTDSSVPSPRHRQHCSSPLSAAARMCRSSSHWPVSTQPCRRAGSNLHSPDTTVAGRGPALCEHARGPVLALQHSYAPVPYAPTQPRPDAGKLCAIEAQTIQFQLRHLCFGKYRLWTAERNL